VAKLFGFSIEDKEKLAPSTLSPVPPNNEDGVDHYITSGFFGSHIDIEGVYRTEFDLIKRYREMALHHEVSSAIEDIVNEAIVSLTNDSPIKIELSNLNASDELKELIRREFKTILELLDFDKKAHEIYRNWYIDGRLYYHKVIDLKQPHQGIQELRYIDAMKMRHVRRAKKEDKTKQILRNNIQGEVNPLDLAFPELEEYFVYTPRAEQPIGTPSTGQLGGSDAGIKFAKDSITYCTSGLVDRNKGTTLSYLNIAIKPLNQLRMIEDAIVIYRLTRSVERRIFYIDVGNLPKAKAEQFLRETMLRYRNKLNYNSTTGEVTDSRRQMSMMEDFFLPRREGGRGTEITTLPPGCFSMDTKVSLLDGRELSIREVEEEMNNGKQLWTYSCNPDTGKIVPGLISWAGVTQKSAQVIKLTLDNGEEIICTPEHKFVAREGGFVEAQNFKIGDSLMPLHRKKEKISANASSYEMVYDNFDMSWKFTHRVMANECKDSYSISHFYESHSENLSVIHHKDFDRFNNNPDNLCFMGWDDHSKLHSHLSSPERFKLLKDKYPDEYKKLQENVSRKSKEYWASLTEAEYNIQVEKISKGIKNYFDSLSPIERQQRQQISAKNGINGNKATSQKLKEDKDFNLWFRQRISDGWTDEAKSAASERAKERHKILWQDDEYRKKYKDQHRKNQKLIFHKKHFDFICEVVKNKTTHQVTGKDVCHHLNSNSEMFNLFIELNQHKSIPNCNVFNGFRVTMLNNLVKQFGYSSWVHFRRDCSVFNHKIASIEWLSEPMEVGTLTIDSNEEIHDYHTFALSAGVFVKNSNLGELTDLNYFKKELYKSLEVPSSRIDGDGGFNLGRSSEILRDEVKFSKFVGRLRKRFANLFVDLLKTQLILKNIVTPEDWKRMSEHIQFDFLYDNHFAELKEAELLSERLNMVSLAEPYVGKYFSRDYLRRNVLKQTDEEIVEQDKIIEKEIEDGLIPDPNSIDPETGMPFPQEDPAAMGNNIQGDAGKVPVDPQIDTSSVEAPKPKGGEI
jgi:hypothetical protein